jgi:hypothetical protein
MDNITKLKNSIGQTVTIDTEWTYHDDVTVTKVDNDNVYIEGYDSGGNSTDYILPLRDILSVDNG